MACGDSLYDFSVYLGFNISEGSDQLVSSPSMVEALCRSVQPKFLQSARRHSTRSRCSSPPKFPALVKLQPSGIDTVGTSVEKLPSLNSHIKKHTTEQTSTATAPCGGLTNIKPRMFGLPGNTGKALDKDTLQEDVDSLLGDSRSQQSVHLSQLCPAQNKLSAYAPQKSPVIRPTSGGSLMRVPLGVLDGADASPSAARAKIQRVVRAAVKTPPSILKQKSSANRRPRDMADRVASPRKVKFSKQIQVLYYLPEQY